MESAEAHVLRLVSDSESWIDLPVPALNVAYDQEDGFTVKPITCVFVKPINDADFMNLVAALRA